MILYILYFSFFYLGAILGSFLNVFSVEIEVNVFESKNTKKTFWQRINRRSACSQCKKELQAKNLFPLFSFIFQKGRCDFCKAKIAPRYFLIEIFSGIIFLFLFIYIFNKYNLNFSVNFWTEFLFLTPIFMGLIIIFLFDLKHKIIPNLIIYPTFILTVLYSLFYFTDWKIFLESFYFAFPFFLIWFFSKGKAMGFADWKLIFLLSILIPNFDLNLSFVFLSFWIGAIYALPLLIWSKKHSLKSEIPFGPFILIAFFIIYFFEFNIFDFYQIIL